MEEDHNKPELGDLAAAAAAEGAAAYFPPVRRLVVPALYCKIGDFFYFLTIVPGTLFNLALKVLVHLRLISPIFRPSKIDHQNHSFLPSLLFQPRLITNHTSLGIGNLIDWNIQVGYGLQISFIELCPYLHSIIV